MIPTYDKYDNNDVQSIEMISESLKERHSETSLNERSPMNSLLGVIYTLERQNLSLSTYRILRNKEVIVLEYSRDLAFPRRC